MTLTGRVTDYDPDSGLMTITAEYGNFLDVIRKGYRECEIRLDDGRAISAKQRRKARAIVADICTWAGYDVRTEADNVHETLKAYMCDEWGYEDFSLGNTDMTTAREYINYLINFCLRNDVPCLDSLLNRTDDIDAYLYACLFYGKCCICGRRGDLHHEQAIGMGRDRTQIIHEGIPAIELCRGHHTEAETIGREAFREKYHVYGIPLDKILCRKHGLKTAAPFGAAKEERNVKQSDFDGAADGQARVQTDAGRRCGVQLYAGRGAQL